MLIIKHLRISVKYFYVRLFFCAVCRCFKNKIEQKKSKKFIFIEFFTSSLFDGIFLNLYNSLKIKRVTNCKFDVFRYLTCKSMKIWKCHKFFYRARYTIEWGIFGKLMYLRINDLHFCVFRRFCFSKIFFWRVSKKTLKKLHFQKRYVIFAMLVYTLTFFLFLQT